MNIQKRRRQIQSRQCSRLQAIVTTKTAIASIYRAVEQIVQDHGSEYEKDKLTIATMQQEINEIRQELDREDVEQVKRLQEIEHAFVKFRDSCLTCEEARATTIDVATELIDTVNEYMLPLLPKNQQEAYRINIDLLLDTTGNGIRIADDLMKKLRGL